jgi:O-antigen ligase
LIGLAWTLPFLQPHHRFPLTGFYSEWLAFALALAAALALLHREPWRQAEIPVVALAPVGLIGVLGLQAASGGVPYPEQAFTATLYLLWAALLVMLGRVLAREIGLPAMAALLAWFLLAGGLLTALIGLLQHFQVSTPIDFLIGRAPAGRVIGNLGQPNHTASYVALSLVSLIYLHGMQRLRPAPAFGCAALCLLLLTLAASRSAWLYLGAATALALLLHYRRRDAVSRRLALAAVWLLPGFLVAQGVAALPFMAQEEAQLASVERLFQPASGLAARLQLWGEAWQMFLGAPLTGAGWGRFSWHHFLHEAATGAAAAPGVFNHAHNVVLQLMAETGLVGASLVLGAIGLWIADLRRTRLDAEGWWLLASLSVVAIHSLLEYPLWYSYFLGVAAFLLGAGAQRVVRLRVAAAGRLAAGLGLAVGWMNLAAVPGDYRTFERLVFTPGGAAAAGGDAAFTQVLVGLYREPVLVPYLELAIAYGVEVSEDRLADKLALVSRAAHFAPVSVVAYRYALLLALSGEREAARAQLGRALRVYPGEAGAVARQIEALARLRPAEFGALLELTAASAPAGAQVTK